MVSTDRDEVCTAAHVLLKTADTAMRQAVLSQFANAQGARLSGLRDALSMAPTEACREAMQLALQHAPAPTAAAAAVVLANHRWLDPAMSRLEALLLDADPRVGELAWRAVLRADVAARVDDPSRVPLDRPFAVAVAHADADLRSSAWEALVWSGRAEAIDWLRDALQRGDEVAAGWLAIVGGEDDAPLIQQAALSTDDPTTRCALLARYGHPSGLNALVRWMDPADLPLAVAAGLGFRRITGVDVHGQRMTLPVAEDADDFTREMAPLVWQPDPMAAHTLMLSRGPEWFQGSRWCEGLRMDVDIDRDRLASMDLQARWDLAARSAIDGQTATSPPPIQ